MDDRTAAATRSVFFALVVVILGGGPVRGANAQILSGSILEDVSGLPIAGAAVRLLDAEERDQGVVISDDQGRFSVRLPAPGTYRLAVSRVGYAPARSGLFRVEPDHDVSVDVFLTVQPVSLDSLLVVTKPRVSQLERVGFYRRKRSGFGYFIEREEIERSGAILAADIFYWVPFARVVTVRSHEYDVTLRGCLPTIVIDGYTVRAQGKNAEVGRWNDLVHPNYIEAIEVYLGPAGAPVQYGGLRGKCGAILIWTQ
ncbi:MAG: carboxypeptidase regulatory-like domain-containing protein [Gemmatimonadetes bacterium]|nr:carboxypeptidase regulatory-like domain-containing protein [Gemmatimonadota bacterium]